MLASRVRGCLKLGWTTWYYLQLANRANADSLVLKKGWSSKVLQHLKIQIAAKGQGSDLAESMILVGNHTSYLDIPLLMNFYPQVSFLSKAEVRKWPLFGIAAAKAETIFVQRDSFASRKSVRKQIADGLLQSKKKLVVFPSGTTTLLGSQKWSKGIFEIAQELNLQVQPFRIRYQPSRLAAYIDQDFFPTHVYRLFHPKSEVKAFIEFRQPMYIKDVAKDIQELKQWCESEIQ